MRTASTALLILALAAIFTSNVLAQSSPPNFSVEFDNTLNIVGVAGTELTLSLGDGTTSFVEITDGTGAFALTANGIAAAFSGNVAFNVPGEVEARQLIDIH